MDGRTKRPFLVKGLFWLVRISNSRMRDSEMANSPTSEKAGVVPKISPKIREDSQIGCIPTEFIPKPQSMGQ
ncbi:hypothetical protein EBT16_12830 [bacterium]|nr:hypothetical protein [bacterium]